MELGLAKDQQGLAPVEHRARWIASGLALQMVGIGVPAAVVLERAKQDGLLGQLTRYTLRLVWHEALRSPSDVALIVLGVGVFTVGSVLLARPFVTRRSTLLVSVPIAATVGVLALGIAALICAALIALAALLGEDLSWLDLFDWQTPGGGGKRRQEDTQDPP